MAQERVFGQWLTAWAGKYTATLMQRNAGSTLRDWLGELPVGAGYPRIDAPMGEIQKYFASVADSPYDVKIMAEIQLGGYKEYGTWQFQARESDTFAVWQQTVDEIIIKEYLRGQRGERTLLDTFVLANPRGV